jgi:uncharacterized protein YyaL (SSP411 family)
MRQILPKKISDFAKKLSVVFYYPEFKSMPFATKTDDEHLQAAMDWLSLAQDVTKSGGVSNGYDISKKKWGGAYRETTGYIIETFLDYYKLTAKKEYLERAVKMAEWEIEMMEPDGGVGELYPDGNVVKKIFNTGQVILGLCPLFEITSDKKYLNTIIKMADFIVSNQDESGAWIKYSTKGPKTIDTRVAWSLLQVYKLTDNKKYKTSARKNLDWAISQQKENFWFDKTSFTGVNSPWTHMIVYTISGLLESYLLEEKDEKIYKSFYGAAEKMLECYRKTKNNGGFLSGTFDENWQGDASYSCLTGDAQIAIVWMQIYKMTGEKRFLDGACDILEQVKSTQILKTKHAEIRGGILGPYPFYRGYAEFLLINWAAKFFADALILKNKIKK